MKSSQVYNTEMGFSGGIVVLAESDASRFGVFAVCSKRLNHFTGVIKNTYYIEALELQDIGDNTIVPMPIDYIEFKTKAALLKAFKNYSIK